MNLVASLCQLAAGGRSIITTIHQVTQQRTKPVASPERCAQLAALCIGVLIGRQGAVETQCLLAEPEPWLWHVL